MSLTPTDRRAALATIGWSQRELARQVQLDEGSVRRWMRDGGAAPAEVDAWLVKVAAFHAKMAKYFDAVRKFHEENPPPSLGPRPIGRPPNPPAS